MNFNFRNCIPSKLIFQIRFPTSTTYLKSYVLLHTFFSYDCDFFIFIITHRRKECCCCWHFRKYWAAGCFIDIYLSTYLLMLKYGSLSYHHHVSLIVMCSSLGPVWAWSFFEPSFWLKI